jgi:hypothetical protein
MRKYIISIITMTAVLAWGEAGVIPPQGWTPISGTQYNMSLYALVLDFGGGPVEAPGSTLAAFDSSGQCRGTARIEEGPVGKWYQMTVVSNAASETGLTLKVLDSRDGAIHDIKETFDFVSESTLPAENYTEEPWTLHFKPLTADLTITLVQNWNWVSFNVQQGERTLAEFLENYTQHATNGDIIKSQSGQATYSGGKWYPSPANFRLEPGRMYKLRKQAAGSCELTVSGAPADCAEPLAVVAGWNWLGYTGEAAATVSAIFKEGGFDNNDLLKPQAGAQATFSGGKWYGSLILRPGGGYMLKQATPGTVDFRNAKENAAR